MTTDPPEAAIEVTIGELGLKNQVGLLSGAGMFTLRAEPEIGLEQIVMSDGPTGVRGSLVVGGRVSRLLPNATLIAQNWSLGEGTTSA